MMRRVERKGFFIRRSGGGRCLEQEETGKKGSRK
jgi:hypothetical protein